MWDKFPWHGAMFYLIPLNKNLGASLVCQFSLPRCPTDPQNLQVKPSSLSLIGCLKHSMSSHLAIYTLHQSGLDLHSLQVTRIHFLFDISVFCSIFIRMNVRNLKSIFHMGQGKANRSGTIWSLLARYILYAKASLPAIPFGRTLKTASRHECIYLIQKNNCMR